MASNKCQLTGAFASPLLLVKNIRCLNDTLRCVRLRKYVGRANRIHVCMYSACMHAFRKQTKSLN